VRLTVLVVVFALLPLCARAADVRLTGRVVDENGAAVPGARVSVKPAAADAAAPNLQAIADPTGAFALEFEAPGDYLIGVERQGFFRLKDHAIHLNDGANEVTLVLNPAREVFEKVDIAYSPPAIDFDRTTPEERLTGNQVLEIPYASTNTLRNVIRAAPGIVQDSQGNLHLNGGTEEQVLYTLDGFEINDPVSGRFNTRLSVESVRSMDISGFNSAEFGKGSAGTLALKTAAGDDRFRYSATNFVPGLENRKGIAIGGWTPRFNFSGPIRKGRAWFSDSIDLQYDNNIIEELPKGQDRSGSLRGSNLLRNQINLAPSNILFTGFLAGFWGARRNGLSALDPVQTTLDRRARQWFFNIKDQAYFKRGALAEFGYAATRTFGRDIPQGQGILLMTPDGRRGNAFFDATYYGARDQFLANLFLPTFTFLGTHQPKLGTDLQSLSYSQDIRRTGYDFIGSTGAVVRSVVFGGSGRLRITDSQQSFYVQDSWKPRSGILVEIGLRQDWDRILGNANLAPRLGFSWAPPVLEFTKISGGFGVVYDAVNLQMFSRPLDQFSVATQYLPGGQISRGPAVSVFAPAAGALRTPQYRNWNLSAEQRFGGEIYARVEYTRRRGRDGFTYLNALDSGFVPGPDMAALFGYPQFDAVYRLGNERRDKFDSVEITVRQTFKKQYDWMASYARSRAVSTSVVDINLEQPYLITQNAGRMPWDSPNRFLSWGYLPTFRPNWAVAYLLEMRDGFPFSVQDETGQLVGGLNRLRFPFFFELNLHLERRFVFRKNRWAFRFGFTNITNHKNPNVVNGDVNSPNYLALYGGQSRALNFRIRWLGKN
jgi:hypothetical protein